MVSFQTYVSRTALKSHLTTISVVQLSIWILPWIVPRALAFYRSIRTSSQGPNSAIRPPPPHVKRCLNILYAAVFISVLLSFPYFSPSNIFQETKSRLGLDTSLLRARLNHARQGNITEMDRIFLEKLESEPKGDHRAFPALYAAYGPDAVLGCTFCKPSEPRDYLYYSLPALVAPHLVHIALLGFVTSSIFSGLGKFIVARKYNLPKSGCTLQTALLVDF
jgi:hypothetical protein